MGEINKMHRIPESGINGFNNQLFLRECNADQYASVVLDDSLRTRSYRRAASPAAASHVDPMSDHFLVSPVLYAMPCPNKHYTQTLVTL